MPLIKFTNKFLLELIVLTMIDARSYTTLEILQKLESINFKIPKGSLYPLLARLKNQKMIVAYFEEMDTGSAKKCLDLTEDGQRRLKELKNYWRDINRLVYKAHKK